MKFAIRLTAAVALLAVMTVIAEARPPEPSAECFSSQQLSDVVRIRDLPTLDGGRVVTRGDSQCSHTKLLLRIDTRGDPDTADFDFTLPARG